MKVPRHKTIPQVALKLSCPFPSFTVAQSTLYATAATARGNFARESGFRRYDSSLDLTLKELLGEYVSQFSDICHSWAQLPEPTAFTSRLTERMHHYWCRAQAFAGPR